jgi:PAS domain S-box-containing protein
MPMNAFTRILIVEDLATDAELAEREINKALSSCVFQRVETREDYLAALAAFQPDLIVSDYQMPRFDGLEALKLAQEHASHTPLIILTGAMNEDTAVECMKAGATDYVIKEHIKRLGSAVIHALEEKQVRRERRRAEEALRKSEERFRGLYENATIGLYRTTPEGRILMANPAAVRMLGYDSFDELAQRDLEEMGFASACARGEFRQRLESEGVITGLESAWLRKDGSIIFVRESARAIRDERGKVLYYDGTFEDVTERKRAEQVQAAIYRISEAAQATQNLDELFAVIHAIIGELMPAKNFYIGLRLRYLNTSSR